jgi:hypothetical protein
MPPVVKHRECINLTMRGTARAIDENFACKRS